MTGEPIYTANKKKMVPHTPAINYRLKSEVSITQLCSIHYTVLQIKNCGMNFFIVAAIKVATMKNTDDFRFEGKLSCYRQINTFHCQQR